MLFGTDCQTKKSLFEATMEKIFPTLLILLSLGAAVCYCIDGYDISNIHEINPQ
jgi:hypothetical protein